MKDKLIDIFKSKTIKTENIVGREAYRKVHMHLTSEIEDGDDFEECKNIVDNRIEDFFKKEEERLVKDVEQINQVKL